MKKLKRMYQKFEDSRFIVWLSRSRAMAAYMKLPKYLRVGIYIVMLMFSTTFGAVVAMTADGIYSYAKSRYEHYEMTRYGIVDPAAKVPLLPDNILDAFKEDGYQIVVRPDHAYLEERDEVDAFFDKETKLIVLRHNDDGYVPYHEMGHYVDWKCGKISKSDTFQDIYQEEADDYSLENADYSRSEVNEYFASCFAMYYLEPTDLEEACPESYAYISGCIKNF